MAPASFKTLTIAVSGTFPGYKQADLKCLITQQGASFSTSVTVECTHLLTNEKDIQKNSLKYQAASKSEKCHVVSINWLLESIEKKKPLTEKSYALGPDSSSQSAPDDTKKNGKDKDPKKETKSTTSDTQDVKKDQDNEDGDKAKKSSKKRGAKKEEDANANDDDNSSGSNKKPKDSQKPGFKSVVVPVDEEIRGWIPLDGSKPLPHVLVNDTIWDATLNQSDSTANANKFYRIQVVFQTEGDAVNYFTWTRWGRVGEKGHTALKLGPTLDAATRVFEKKFKDKSGLKWEDRYMNPKSGKYTFIDRSYEEDDDEKKVKNESNAKKPPVESQLPWPVQNLMSFIFNQDNFLSAMKAMDYDAEKLPLGKLSERTLKQGFSVLKDLSELIIHPELAVTKYSKTFYKAAESLSNQYFTIIPHVFGRNRPPVLSTGPLIKKEVELLEALTDMDVANDIMKEALDVDEVNQLDQQFKGLGLKEMSQLDHNTKEFQELSNYLKKSSGSTHNIRYQVVDIFRIERNGEQERFEQSPYAKLSGKNRRLLWHGSRSTNFGGILSQGLRIAPPEAPVNGYMFGKGVYLADTSTKSANYCCASNSGKMALLLLCEAELGDPMHELYYSDYNAGENSKVAGKIATLGQGRAVPGGWKDAGSFNKALDGVKMPDVSLGLSQDEKATLRYNEYIVYDVAQIRQRYLFYVKIN